MFYFLAWAVTCVFFMIMCSSVYLRFKHIFTYLLCFMVGKIEELMVPSFWLWLLLVPGGK